MDKELDDLVKEYMVKAQENSDDSDDGARAGFNESIKDDLLKLKQYRPY